MSMYTAPMVSCKEAKMDPGEKSKSGMGSMGPGKARAKVAAHASRPAGPDP